jgi:hypothetical protein
MADNVGYTAGSGVNIASREVSYSGQTAQAQVVGLATFAGSDDAKTIADVSDLNPLPIAAYGELVEALESMRFAINQLTKSIGFALPNASGQPIMEVRQATAGNLNVTVGSGTVTVGSGTITTLTNQAQIGGLNANDQLPALMNANAGSLRRNISVT